MSNGLKLECLDLHGQILHRPDTYIGGTKRVKYNEPVWAVKDKKITLIKPCFSEGLLRIFVEVISNSTDNVWRSSECGIKCSYIKVNIDSKTGLTSVVNDGRPISIELHDREVNKYIPELMYSRLLSSTNYNDSEERKTSGRNGYGVKLTNIFSREFSIELCNTDSNLKYTQKWSDNMKTRGDYCISKIKDGSSSKNYTRVEWIPDFSRFDCDGYDDDSISMITKYIYDTAMIVSKYGVSVYFNDELVPISSLQDYALMYGGGVQSDIYNFKSRDSNIVIIPFSKHVNVSFVNGLYTTEGGIHSDQWIEAIFRPITDKINGKKSGDEKKERKEKRKKGEDKKIVKKEKELSIDDVYRYFAVFIECEVDKPEFRGQNKTKLVSPKVDVNVKPSDIQKIMKWSVIDDIKRLLEIRDLAELKIKKRGFTKIDGLEDANYSKKSSKRGECILTVTEGLSARTYVVEGMQYGLQNRHGQRVVGRDYIGALPIRGKFINPKGRSMKSVAANKEVKSLIQALGLQVGVDYTSEENLKSLRYGRLSIFADSDVDGQHIIGLLYNFISTLYPSLLMVDGFFCFVRTPIIKIDFRHEKLVFYHLSLARKFIKDNGISKKNIKYYKGLGTSTSGDIKQDFGKRIVNLQHDENTDETIDNIFNKKKSGYRKEWITCFKDEDNDESDCLVDGEVQNLSLPNFINREFINFSIDDCRRSIPSILDGLKESQRKILYSVFKKKLKKGTSIKVAQLSGYVAENTNYHHGEDNLMETIRGMAQRFVGSNNMPFLEDIGQFGSRLENGQDGASGRYIFTTSQEYLRDLFIEQDDYYLENLEDDGDVIEKKVYVPIIPTILVNGATGIGTGFSTSIPCYNPLDLIEWIRQWIHSDGAIFEDLGGGICISDGPELKPWYRGFTGKIEVSGDKITTYGNIQEISKNKYRVTEIPIGKKNMSISKFKEKLEELLEKKSIKDFDSHSGPNSVDFTIVEDNDGMKVDLTTLSLVDSLHTSNMVLFSSDGKIKKYETVEHIMNEYCAERLKLYDIRRRGEIQIIEYELEIVKNKIRFINEVNSDGDDRLNIRNVEEDEIFKEMESRGYKKRQKIKRGFHVEDDDDEGTYNYLLDMKIRLATKTRIATLISEREKLEKSLEELKSIDAKGMWILELGVLEKKYKVWCKNN